MEHIYRPGVGAENDEGRQTADEAQWLAPMTNAVAAMGMHGPSDPFAVAVEGVLAGSDGEALSDGPVTNHFKIGIRLEMTELALRRATIGEDVVRLADDTNRQYSWLSDIVGRGMFGMVFLGTSRATGLRVAIKRVRNNIEMAERQLREVECLRLVAGHANILHFERAFFPRDGTGACEYFDIVTEFVNGGDLGSLIERKGILSEPEAKAVLRQIASAVRHMTKKNVCHRDVNPANILIVSIEPELIVKLGDFGAAKVIRTDNGKHTCIGTPGYIAPEVIRGDYGKSVDIYSLGIVILSCSIGRLPSPMRPDEIQHRLTSTLGNWPEATILRGMVDKVPKNRPSTTEILKNSWVQDGDAKAVNALVSRLLRMPDPVPKFAGKAFVLDSFEARGSVLGFRCALRSGWKEYKALSSMVESWQPIKVLLSITCTSKQLRPLTELLKRGGKIGGSDKNGYFEKHALTGKAETERLHGWMDEATKVWSAISAKLIEFGISEATSFSSANATAVRAINVAFDEAQSAGFRDVSKVARSDIAGLLAAVHVFAGTKHAEENQ